MPKAGDTLRYSNANPISAIDLTITGPASHWVFPVEPVSQAIDTYKKAYQVNPSFATSISLAANGVKIADSIPGLSFVVPGIRIENFYQYYETLTTPHAYATTFMSAKFLGLLTLPIHYTIPDVIYFFPLNYLREDSSDFEFNFLVPLADIGFKQKGYRKTKVDGWGDIMTPYLTAPKPCIRVRSEIHEMDSIILDSIRLGIPRVTVEYKWLVNGERYPAMWVTTTNVSGFDAVTGVKYRDYYRPELDPTLSVTSYAAKPEGVSAYPNPAIDGFVMLDVPDAPSFTVAVYDMQSRLAGVYKNEKKIDIRNYPAGSYMAIVTAADKVYYVRFVK
jgi:hypothetical protein